MQPELLLAIQAHANQFLPEIKHIDLFNNQVEQLRSTEPGDHPFDLPALFVEMMPIEWHTHSKAQKRGTASLMLHVVQNIFQDTQGGSSEQADALDLLRLPENVDGTFENFNAGDGFSIFQGTQFIPDNNYDNVIQTMCMYSFDVIVSKSVRGKRYVEVEAGLKVTGKLVENV